MEQEILDIIYSYTFTNKLLDKKAVLEIIKILIKKYSLSDKIKSIYISEKTNIGYRGEYKCSIKSIMIHLYEMYENQYFVFNFKTQTESIFCKNILILQTILHEFRHAQQKKFPLIENLIVNDISMSVLEDNILYMNIYDYIPAERDAEIFSHNEIIKILLKEDKIFPTTLECVKYLLYRTMHEGYSFNKNQEIETPFFKFCKNASLPEVIYPDIVSLLGDSPFYKRIRFGLPITLKELNKIENEEKKFIIKYCN